MGQNQDNMRHFSESASGVLACYHNDPGSRPAKVQGVSGTGAMGHSTGTEAGTRDPDTKAAGPIFTYRYLDG